MPVSTQRRASLAGRAAFNLLRLLNGMVYPVLVVGSMHVVFEWMIGFPDVPRSVAMAWLVIGLLWLLAGVLAYLRLGGLADRGLLAPVVQDIAARFYSRASRRLLLAGDEMVMDCAVLRTAHGPALLVLTDRRVVIANFRGWPRVPWQVTECDRRAVKVVREIEVERNLSSLVRGAFYTGQLEIELIGVGAPQRLEFVEPHSRARVVQALGSQPRMRPDRHGIRLIQYHRRRRVLKRRYVDRLFPVRHVPFVNTVMLSAIFPGVGQMHEGRWRTGLPYAGFFLVALLAMLVRAVGVIGAGEASSEAIFLAPQISMLVIWLVSILELFIHRQIHVAGDY